MRIKHAYNTLLNSEARRKYDSGNSRSDSSYSGAQRSQSRVSQDEEFYGFGKNFILIDKCSRNQICKTKYKNCDLDQSIQRKIFTLTCMISFTCFSMACNCLWIPLVLSISLISLLGFNFTCSYDEPIYAQVIF